MKMIPNIKLNDKDFRELLVCNKISAGSEAIICSSNNPNTLYKIFWNYHKKSPMSDNKIEKIKLLYQMNLEYCVKPISTISYSDMIVGYEMTTDYNLYCYELYQLSNDELIYYLRKTKDILDYFSSNGIIYGDVASRNILFNKETGDIKFCDMDNIHIKNFPMDVTPYYLSEYMNVRSIDYGIHPYMHNIMTLKAFEIYIYYYNNIDINRYFTFPAKKIINSMKNLEHFENKYLVRYIKKKK